MRKYIAIFVAVVVVLAGLSASAFAGNSTVTDAQIALVAAKADFVANAQKDVLELEKTVAEASAEVKKADAIACAARAGKGRNLPDSEADLARRKAELKEAQDKLAVAKQVLSKAKAEASSEGCATCPKPAPAAKPKPQRVATAVPVTYPPPPPAASAPPIIPSGGNRFEPGGCAGGC